MIAGVVLRFVNLDRKVFWIDEAHYSIIASGHRYTDFQDALYDGHVFSVAELKSYLRPEPASGIREVLSAKAQDAKHTPFSYLLYNWWGNWQGFDVCSLRLLTAILSLLALPFLYWLSLELFESQIVSAIYVALIAASPLHYLYAQEARGYYLWCLITALTGVLQLRAFRLRKNSAWLSYSAAVAFGLYSFLLSCLVTAAQLVYSIYRQEFEGNRSLTRWLGSVALALIAFSPWLFVLIKNWNHTLHAWSWVEKKFDAATYAMHWLGNFGLLFYDLNLPRSDPSVLLAGLTALLLTICAIAFLWHGQRRSTFVFVVLLIASTALPLLCLDLLFGGRRALTMRYLMPSWLGIELAIAHLLAQLCINRAYLARQIGLALITAIIIVGIGSCIYCTQAFTWWHKVEGQEMLDVAERINSRRSPLLLIDKAWCLSPGRVAALGNLLTARAKIAIVAGSADPNIPDGYEDVFLFHMPESYVSKLRSKNNRALSRDAKLGDSLWLARSPHSNPSSSPSSLRLPEQPLTGVGKR